jgi:hypothetical protein
MVTQITYLMKKQTNFIALQNHVMKRLQHTTQILMIAIVKLAMLNYLFLRVGLNINVRQFVMQIQQHLILI